jgi:K+-sensing histidine kinase KdpD
MDKNYGAGVADTCESSAARSLRLLQLLAHDLRSPLAAVMTNLGFVETAIPPTDLEAIDAVSDARLSCAALEHLIANLDVIASEGTSPAQEPTSLWVVAQSAVARCERIAGTVGIPLALARVGDCPDVVTAPVSLGRALDNLLANSVQYSSEGRVVRVIVERSGQHGTIAVLDSGMVVPERFRQAAFTAEGQLLGKHHPECRYGRGLGLYCAGLAAAVAGATITAGERDGGSVFLLAAPLAAAL